MKKAAVGILLLATSFAQDQPAVSRARGACGPANVQFEVKTEKADKKNAPTPAMDKALVYIFESQRAGCFMCDTTVRIGMDGAWAGATKGKSYFSFPVASGEHHFCADLQAASSSETTGLLSLNADAGKTYYFRVKLTDQNNSGRGGVDWAVDLEAIDADEGQFLISSYEVSSYKKR